jgi:hypothetical protein
MNCTMGWGKQEGEEAVEQATLSLASPRTLRPRMHGRGISSREISVDFCCLRSHFQSVLFKSHTLVTWCDKKPTSLLVTPSSACHTKQSSDWGRHIRHIHGLGGAGLRAMLVLSEIYIKKIEVVVRL